MMQDAITVTKKGPLWDGRASAAIHSFIDEATEKIASEGVNEIHARLGEVLKHPTGYYESHVVTDRSSVGSVVTDGGVIYGPWLEGVSSRNQSTRFKGYSTFRKVTQRLQAAAGPIAEIVLKRYIGRMN